MRLLLPCGLLGLSVLAGCSSPPAQFYRLSADSSLTPMSARAPAQPVIVGPVTLPEMVDRPQIVTRSSDNQVAINEYARWGAPLKSDIADAIAADLTLLLGSNQVANATRAVPEEQDWRVRVDFQQFESVPGDAIAIDARWSVRRLGDEHPIAGRSLVREPVSGTDYTALVAAHSRALASVSRDIATAIERNAMP